MTEINTPRLTDDLTKDMYIQIFKRLRDASELMDKLPLPGPSTLKFYQRILSLVDKQAAADVTIKWAKTLMDAYDDYTYSRSDWFEKHFQKKTQAPVSAQPISVSVDVEHIVEEVNEKVTESLKTLGNSLATVLKGMQRDSVNELEIKHSAQRRVIDEKFQMLEKTLLQGLLDSVKDQVELAVLTNLDHITHAIVESVSARVPDLIKSKVDTLVDMRLAEIFSTKETEAEKEPQIDSDKLAAAVNSSNSFRMAKPKKDEALGNTNRSLKLLVLDLNKDQLSRAKNGISEKYATFDIADAVSLTDAVVDKYDYIIATHYTSKTIGKTAAQTWPDKYVLADGNFPAVRSTAQRLINEFRKERVV